MNNNNSLAHTSWNCKYHIVFAPKYRLKYKYGNRQFWCRGYYVDTAGKNTKKIAEYIRDQLKEDQIHDQMTMREYEDPFTGSGNNPLASVRPYQRL